MLTFFDNSIEFVKFGNIIMTREAQLILISGIVLTIILFIYYGFEPIFLLILLNYIILAYKVNCMQVGSCNLFAKIISLGTFIGVCYIIFYGIK
jgi:hypothetical protein